MKSQRMLKYVLGAVALVAVMMPQGASACAVCFGGPDQPLTKGMAWGILSLLFIILSVLGGIAAFFVYMAKRAAQFPLTAEVARLETVTTKV